VFAAIYERLVLLFVCLVHVKDRRVLGHVEIAVVCAFLGRTELVPRLLCVHRLAEQDAFSGIGISIVGFDEGQKILLEELAKETWRAYTRTDSAVTSATAWPGTLAAAAAVTVSMVILWLELTPAAVRIEP
jgi:hypothetical protein